MVKHIRIPGLLDVIRVDDASTIAAVSEDPRLDRDYARTGPIFNRMLALRVRRILSITGEPLPTMRARHDGVRARQQAELAAALDPARTLWSDEGLNHLAAYVRGASEGESEDVGAAVQTVVGRLFDPDYLATATTWTAARRLDASVRSRNPLRWIYDAVTGRTRRARDRLAAAAKDNPAAVHAIGIAVHNILASFERMRNDFANPSLRALDSASAATRSLVAPQSVLRQAKSPGSTAAGDLSPGTLVTFELETAARARLDVRVAFMTASWSVCPADRFVRALLMAVWDRAKAQQRDARP